MKVFEGIRVADFSWVGVGPVTAKYLADHGAEVIRIESTTAPDVLRMAGPFAGGQMGIDRSGYYANFNSSKLSCSLNLKNPKAIELAKRLVSKCDVVTESFTPGFMRRLGLGYEELKKVKPDIIMISMSLYGQDGPWAHFAGFGHVLQGAAGTNWLTGWPDGEPLGAGTPFTDFFVPHISATALVAALDYRRRTGKGQYIDFSQYEAGTYALETALLDYIVNGHEQMRMGNRHPQAAPHGCYRCWGDDRWVTIACFTHEEWQALRQEMGDPAWAQEPVFATLEGRKANEDKLDQHIQEWTKDKLAEEVMHRLQARGVPAGVVQTAEDLRKDPQLGHRHHYWFLEHPEMGVCAYDGPSFRLSKTPGELSRPAPLLGQHNEYVWKEIAGLTDDEFTDLLVEGCFE